MRNYEKGVFALRPSHRQFIAYCQCCLCVQFTGREGLADLITQHVLVPFLLSPRYGLVLGLREQKLRVGSFGVALISDMTT